MTTFNLSDNKHSPAQTLSSIESASTNSIPKYRPPVPPRNSSLPHNPPALPMKTKKLSKRLSMPLVPKRNKKKAKEEPIYLDAIDQTDPGLVYGFNNMTISADVHI